jgi:hypothetical protein
MPNISDKELERMRQSKDPEDMSDYMALKGIRNRKAKQQLQQKK